MAQRIFACFMIFACLAAACGGKKKAGIAELTKADGPVERQAGLGAWAGAALGTRFFLGDAARTADGAARITLAGSQVLEMQAHTVLRFGPGANNATTVKVEVGAVDIVNTGQLALEIGNVKVAPGGKVRITSNDVELLIGHAQLQGVELIIGKPVGIEIGLVQAIDAGVAVPSDGPPEAPSDAGLTTQEVAFEITGKGVELQGPNAKTWVPLEGKGTLPLGAKVRIKKAGAKAMLISGATTLELSGASSQLTIRENLLIGMDLGTGTATVAAATAGKVGVPGGEVDLQGAKDQAGEAKIDVNARGEAKISMVHGASTLVSANGTATFDLTGGESATLLKGGAINPGIVIPHFFDFKINVADAPKSFSVHDPHGSTAIQFAFQDKCPSGGTVELDHSSAFRTPRVSEGKESANMLVPQGSWAWRLVCSGGSVASHGQVSVVADSGRRPLPQKLSTNKIDADGRIYSIAYQSLIPNVVVKFKGTGGSAFKLHLATGGADDVLESTTPSVEIPGKRLKEANYTFWFDKDGVKQDKITQLKISFDQTAAQVYIEAPTDNTVFGADVEVAGAALPGWTAKVDAVEIPVNDSNRRFRAKVPPPTGGALAIAIRLSHPKLGIHYYLRRGAIAK